MQKFLIVLATVAGMLLGLANWRVVAAEDDCADPTWMVQRTAIGLLCIGEGF